MRKTRPAVALLLALWTFAAMACDETASAFDPTSDSGPDARLDTSFDVADDTRDGDASGVENWPLTVAWGAVLSCRGSASIGTRFDGIGLDADDNVLVAGSVDGGEGSCDLFGGPTRTTLADDVVVARLGSGDGALLDGDFYGGEGMQRFIGYASAGGRTAGAGLIEGDLTLSSGLAISYEPADAEASPFANFQLVLDNSGPFQWAELTGTRGDLVVSALGVNAAGVTLLAGLSQRDINFGDGLLESELLTYFLVARDRGGDLLWSTTLGPSLVGEPAPDPAPVFEVEGVTVPDDDGALIWGRLRGTLNLSGEGVLAAETESPCLLALDDAGGFSWGRVWQTASHCDLEVVSTSDDSIVVGGICSGPLDMGAGARGEAEEATLHLARLDSAGQVQWHVPLASSGVADRPTLRLGPEDTIYVSIAFTGAVDLAGLSLSSVGRRDTVLAVVDGSDGALLSHQVFGGQYDDVIQSFELGGDGSVYVLGLPGLVPETMEPGALTAATVVKLERASP